MHLCRPRALPLVVSRFSSLAYFSSSLSSPTKPTPLCTAALADSKPVDESQTQFFCWPLSSPACVSGIAALANRKAVDFLAQISPQGCTTNSPIPPSLFLPSPSSSEALSPAFLSSKAADSLPVKASGPDASEQSVHLGKLDRLSVFEHASPYRVFHPTQCSSHFHTPLQNTASAHFLTWAPLVQYAPFSDLQTHLKSGGRDVERMLALGAGGAFAAAAGWMAASAVGSGYNLLETFCAATYLGIVLLAADNLVHAASQRKRELQILHLGLWLLATNSATVQKILNL